MCSHVPLQVQASLLAEQAKPGPAGTPEQLHISVQAGSYLKPPLDAGCLLITVSISIGQSGSAAHGRRRVSLCVLHLSRHVAAGSALWFLACALEASTDPVRLLLPTCAYLAQRRGLLPASGWHSTCIYTARKQEKGVADWHLQNPTQQQCAAAM